MNLSSHLALIIKKNYPLILILLLFLVTRLFQIESNPPSLYWDEVSISINAHSVLKTGRDETGTYFPLHFEAFGEYKLPVYVYSVVLAEVILGYNELAVRFPAAFFSFLTIVVVYFLIRRLGGSNFAALFGAFYLTVLPWFFIFSRTGYEATAGLFFYSLGIFHFYKGLDKKNSLIISMVCFLLTLYSYNSFRIVTPLTLILLTVINLRELLSQIKKKIATYILCLAIIFVGVLPIFDLFINHNGASRLTAVSSISNATSKPEKIKILTTNYLKHFSSDFLFFNGDANPRSQQPGVGQLYLIDIIVLFTGIIALLKRKKILLLIAGLIAIAIVPASLATEAPHALRTIVSVIPISLLAGFGASFIVETIQKFKLKNLLIAAYCSFFILYVFFFGNYLNSFLNRYPVLAEKHWQNDYKKLFTEYNKNFSNYDHIVISRKYNQPYVYALFYTKYDPEKYLQSFKETEGIYKITSKIETFDKYIFTDVDFEKLPSGKSLIFTTPSEKLSEVKETDIIRYLDNSIAFYVYEYQK